MGKIKDLVIDVDLSDELNVNETKHNVLNLFENSVTLCMLWAISRGRPRRCL